MSKTTNLELFKHDNVTTNTDAFNVEKALNENWDKIDTAIGENNSDIASIKTKNTEQDTRLTNIETKNATQDTSISALQEDVEEMQENIQSNADEIEDLKEETERLKNDINSISITEEAEGEDLTLTETSDARFKKFEIKGNDYQKTREGYNLAKISQQLKIFGNGVPIGTTSSNGTINSSDDNNINYTTTVANYVGFITEIITLTEGEKLTISYELSGSNSNVRQAVLQVNDDGTYINLNLKNAIANGSVSNDYTATSDMNVAIGFWTNNDELYTIDIKNLMACKESTKTYEAYGAMPSLSYKSEIKTIKNSANIAVCNKNLLKITSTTKTVTKNGVTITIDDDGLITIDGTCTTNWWPDLTYNIANNTVVHEEPKYYIPECKKLILSSKYVSGSVSPNFFVSCWYSKNEGSNTSLTLINDSVSKSSELTVNTINRVYLTINEGRVFNNYKFYLQLEEGSTATDCVEPNEQSFTIPVQQEMLTGDGFIKVDGVWKEKHINPIVTFDGSENWIWSNSSDNFVGFVLDYSAKTDGILYCDKFRARKISEINGIDLEGIALRNNNTGFYIRCPRSRLAQQNIASFKNLLNENNIKVAYTALTPTLLECTNQQKQILDELEKTIHTYKEKTHVYSTDELSPIFSVEAIKDTNTVVNNMLSMILANEEV